MNKTNPQFKLKNPGNFTTVQTLNSGHFAGFFYPAQIWLDKHLNPIAKNLLVEISLLEKLPLGCIASNEHFATTLNISKRSAERYIADLTKEKYLTLLTFDGHNRKLKVNFERLEPRQSGEVEQQIGEVQKPQPRQSGEVERQTGDETSTNWRHNSITNEISNNVSTIDREKEKEILKNDKEPEPQELKKLKPDKPKKTTAKKESPKVELPFTSEVFKTAWSDWMKYRAEIKKSYKSVMSQQRVLNQLAKFEEAFAIELIETSITNSWQGLVFPRTGEQYQDWLATKRKKTQGTGTKAKPKANLIEHSRQSSSVYNQLVALEKQREQFKEYPPHMLEMIQNHLRDLWRKAKDLDMFGSEISRITNLGNYVKSLNN